MYIERDKEFDLLYISLGDSTQEREVAHTKEVSPGVIFDMDSEGKLVGIEIANTKEVLGISAANLRLSGELIGVKEAAELTGKDRGNFIRDLARKTDFPEPVAQLASGQVWFSKDIERYLEKRHVSSDIAIGQEGQDPNLTSDGLSQEDSPRNKGDYEYKGSREEDITSASDVGEAYSPNYEGFDHAPYDSKSHEDPFKEESA